MKELRRSHHEMYEFRRRIKLSEAIVLIFFIILLVRFTWLQIIRYDNYSTQSEQNRVTFTPIVPNRGVIEDRNGIVLAHNYSGYTLEIIPSQTKNLEQTINELAKIISISNNDRKRFQRLLDETRGFGSIPIRRLLTDEEVARFVVQKYRFPSVDIHARLFRHYPFVSFGSHMIGHIGRISLKDQERIEADGLKQQYLGSEYMGKAGIEKSYEKELRGETGYEEVETTSTGVALRLLGRKMSVPGRTVQLSIDMKLQQLVEKEYGDRRGAFVAIDPNNGEVLALVSMPTFDPNLFVDGIDQANWTALNESPDKPLLNRTIQGGYPPGSTYKPFMALAALTTGARSYTEVIRDPGYFMFGNHKFRDSKPTGHGTVDMHKSIVVSSDTYYYSLANVMGVDAIHNFMQPFGFGSKTMIDIDNEQSGILPSSEWKLKRFKQKWLPGETISIGIGQGYNTFTPIQLAVAVAAIANRGKIYKPHLVKKITSVNSGEETLIQPELMRTLAISPENFELVNRAMIDVNKVGTSSRSFQGAAYEAAGKTGTAQVFGLKQNEKYQAHKVKETLRDHALFIVYAPAQKPQIAIALIVENGGFGAAAAAPIARKALDYYLVERANFNKLNQNASATSVASSAVIAKEGVASQASQTAVSSGAQSR